MIIIVTDCRRISRAVSEKMMEIVGTASGEKCAMVTVANYADAIRIFKVENAKPITIEELRELLHPQTNGTE